MRQRVFSKKRAVGLLPREEFLLKMYDQLMNDINRHINVVWQSIALVVAAFAAFSVTKEFNQDKGALSLSIVSVLVVLISSWSAAHAYDASFWYNRNLVIIANIERQFLRVSDARLVHPYFLTHRNGNSMISHLRLQWLLAAGVVATVILYHFLRVALPSCCQVSARIDWEAVSPYLTVIVCVCYLNYFRNDKNEKYRAFLEAAPGADFKNPKGQLLVGHSAGNGTVWWKKVLWFKSGPMRKSEHFGGRSCKVAQQG